MILYPYIEGHHGYHRKMTAAEWFEYGRALKRLHSTELPADISRHLPEEEFSPAWQHKVRKSLQRVKTQTFNDPVAKELAAFLRSHYDLTASLVEQAAEYSQKVKERGCEYVVCHGDIHGWTLLIGTDGHLYIADWDTLIRAPKERDLMFIGAGIGDSGYSPSKEADLFFRGYGRAEADPDVTGYYRCNRILEDIAIYCEEILLSDEGEKGREQALIYLMSNYLPGSTIELALRP